MELLVHPFVFVVLAFVVIGVLRKAVTELPAWLGQSSSSSKNEPALSVSEYRSFRLVQKREVSHNTRIFRFALPTRTSLLGLPVGKHIVLRFTDADGKIVSRQYTPITSNDTRGYFELLIKVYPNGKMSTHLEKMAIGDAIEVRGPMGSLEYLGAGRFSIRKDGGAVERTYKQVGMICGGTGITPMYQVFTHMFANPSDTTHVSLVFGNLTFDDILLRTELDALKEKHSTFRRLYHVLNTPPETNWTGGKGFVSADVIREQLPAPSDDTLVCLCGPPPMVNAMNTHLKALGYAEDNIFAF